MSPNSYQSWWVPSGCYVECRRSVHGRKQEAGEEPSNMNFKPSCTSWCALQMSSRPLIWLNSLVTKLPNNHPAPRGLAPHASISSGSLHMRSQNAPSWGISHTRSIVLICSKASFFEGSKNTSELLDKWWMKLLSLGVHMNARPLQISTKIMVWASMMVKDVKQAVSCTLYLSCHDRVLGQTHDGRDNQIFGWFALMPWPLQASHATAIAGWWAQRCYIVLKKQAYWFDWQRDYLI